MSEVGISNSVSSISNGSVLENGINGSSSHEDVLSNHFNNKSSSAFEIITQPPINILPKGGVSKSSAAYSKTTQTEDERVSIGEFSMGSQEFDYDEYSIGDKVELNFDESPNHELTKILPLLKFGAIDNDHNEEQQEEHIPELSEDEKRQILQSDEFSNFFVNAGRVLLRELAEIVRLVFY